MNTPTPSSPVPVPMPITFDAAGLIPVVAQDDATGEVLLLAYMNADALRRTLDEGVLVLWSRSRRALWRKGEQSGHTLRVTELRVNCEGNSLLARVTLGGPGACHDGYRSCYYRRLRPDAASDERYVLETIAERTFDPTLVYGARRATENEDGDASIALESTARALYAAYERLRDTDLSAQSGTSRLLRADDRAATAQHALARAHEELAELRGVLAGTHRHEGLPADVILEAGQVGYWVTVAAVALGYDYDVWQPHMAWLAGWAGRDAPLPAASLTGETGAGLISECAALLSAAAVSCGGAGVHPTEVLAADLAAMRANYSTLLLDGVHETGETGV